MKLVAEADARRLRAECAELEMRVQLCINHEKISALETAEAGQQKNPIQMAVKRTVKSGAYAEEFTMTGQFIADPSLISLTLSRWISRSGPHRR